MNSGDWRWDHGQFFPGPCRAGSSNLCSALSVRSLPSNFSRIEPVPTGNYLGLEQEWDQEHKLEQEKEQGHG